MPLFPTISLSSYFVRFIIIICLDKKKNYIIVILMILIMIFGKFTNLKPEMAAFEMAASQTVAILLILNNSNKSNSYFADFEQVK